MAETTPDDDANLISRPLEEYISQPRYVSKYREKIRRASKRGKSAHKTLGVPSVNLNPPTDYLKKNSKSQPKKLEIHHEHYHRPGYQHKLPDWEPVKLGDKQAEIVGSRSIDFTKRNIDEAKNLRPLKPRKYYVDDRHGTSHPLKTSGLYPLYRNRENYGKVPGRDFSTSGNRSKLRQRKATSPQTRDRIRMKNREKNSIDKNELKIIGSETRSNDDSEDGASESHDSKLAVKSTVSGKSRGKKNSQASRLEKDDESVQSSRPDQPRCRYVTEDERAELLHGMKKKWDDMMRQFQRLPFVTDTPPKAKRKSQMEKDLQQLEKDIEVIERHPYIYVYSDDEENS